MLRLPAAGWTADHRLADVDGRRAVALETLDALRRFEPCTLAPFASSTYPTFSDLNLIFSFYRRPAIEAVA